MAAPPSVYSLLPTLPSPRPPVCSDDLLPDLIFKLDFPAPRTILYVQNKVLNSANWNPNVRYQML